jgi:signal transduction histidine kinase
VELGEETRQECLQTIDEETDRLERIVDNLLDLSQLEGGQLYLDNRPADVGQLTKEIVQSIKVQATRHDFVLDLEHPLVAVIDSKRVEQVLRNLLSNAIKYSPQGGTITVQGHRNEGYVLVGIRDEGIGIPQKELGLIFERFYRVENEITQRVRGTGLGLSVCRGIVEAHGGRIWAESALGEGSTLYFTLPIGQ